VLAAQPDLSRIIPMSARTLPLHRSNSCDVWLLAWECGKNSLTHDGGGLATRRPPDMPRVVNRATPSPSATACASAAIEASPNGAGWNRYSQACRGNEPHAALGCELLSKAKVQPRTRGPVEVHHHAAIGFTRVPDPQYPPVANYLSLAHLMTLKNLNCGVTEGCEVEPGASEEAGPVLHPFEAGPDQRGQLAEVAFGQVGQGSLQVGPHRFDPG
jgi:hypothetical protein